MNALLDDKPKRPRRYEYRGGAVCETHGNSSPMRRDRDVLGPWECCACAEAKAAEMPAPAESGVVAKPSSAPETLQPAAAPAPAAPTPEATSADSGVAAGLLTHETLPPDVLATALQDRIAPASGRLIAAVPLTLPHSSARHDRATCEVCQATDALPLESRTRAELIAEVERLRALLGGRR